ncbi:MULTISPECIES: hypothetical protein [unclassified Streptomyces]|uniref:hypothetical protein n=1 Tax=unclassified Streptomyces TaxID=2593676 RepID=UPI00037D9A52|nr:MULTISPECIES: hypothetical protein [unclassified Streptomyces]MYT30395.1 hypothetical protein [Streptomyces sp. SID8354]
MTHRHTLSVLDWHDDGSSTSSVWVVSADERERVTDFLGRGPDMEGVVTPEQADEARTITRSWLTCANEDSPA